MTTKNCSGCGCTKTIDDFYNQRDGRLGKTSRCKKCMTSYRRSVVDRSAVWHKNNYSKNKARFNARGNLYRDTHVEQLKEHRQTPQYKAKKSAWDRGFYERNALDMRERARRAAIEKPEMYRAYKNSYKAKKRAAFVEFVDVAKVYERDMGLCQVCGLVVENGDFSLDHRMPIAAGGKHSVDNCQTAHLICNIRKQDKFPEQCAHLWVRN